MLKFQNSQRNFLPDPDYHIHLTIRGFKSILFKEEILMNNGFMVAM